LNVTEGALYISASASAAGASETGKKKVSMYAGIAGGGERREGWNGNE